MSPRVKRVIPETWDIRGGSCYLLCFDVSFWHAGHYLGITGNVSRRIGFHQDGRGSHLTRAVHQAGIGMTLTRTWEGANRGDEIRLKDRHGTRLCPRCKEEKIMGTDPQYAADLADAKARFQEALAQAGAVRQEAKTPGAGTRGFNHQVGDAHQLLAVERATAREHWDERHAGHQLAQAHVTMSQGAGVTVAGTAQFAEDEAARLLADAQTPEGQAFAEGYAWTASAMAADLRSDAARAQENQLERTA